MFIEEQRPDSSPAASQGSRAPEASFQTGKPVLDSQPTHRQEFGQDRKRVLAAVSVEPDKYRIVEPFLMDYEQPLAIAVQRKFPFSLFTDIVLLSSHRLLLFRRFFTKIDVLDVNYVDLKDVTIRQGFFTSSLTVLKDDGGSYTLSGLITDQALNVYRLCQNIETKARIARRKFHLEENRSRTNQIQINNVADASKLPIGRAGGGQLRSIEHQDLSDIGDEETDPFRLGE